jgi:hypothetical protein
VDIAEDTGADDTFATIDYSAEAATNMHAVTTLLKYGTTYNWRVRAIKTFRSGPWVTSSFTTVGEPPETAVPPSAGPMVGGQLSFLSPLDGATGVRNQPTFSWGRRIGTTGYDLVIAEDIGRDDPFAAVTYTASTTTDSHVPAVSFRYGTTYNWRVSALSATGKVPWVSSSFTMGAASGAESYELVASTDSRLADPVVDRRGTLALPVMPPPEPAPAEPETTEPAPQDEPAVAPPPQADPTRVQFEPPLVMPVVAPTVEIAIPTWALATVIGLLATLVLLLITVLVVVGRARRY